MPDHSLAADRTVPDDPERDAPASYRAFRTRAVQTWPDFLARRAERLRQHGRFGGAVEKVAEGIVEDLLTIVLDWTLGDLNHQLDRADIVISEFGLRKLVIETKRPTTLTWQNRALEKAALQALGYAGAQKVEKIAISDGTLFYAADVRNGGVRPRIAVRLDAPAAPLDLWWISRHGIYRSRQQAPCLPWQGDLLGGDTEETALTHHKYSGLTADCFAFIGDPTKTRTWKLPFRRADGTIDTARLPKAIQCILKNYRGAKVAGIPDAAIPDTLERLAQGAREIGKLPALPGSIYADLQAILAQLGRDVDAAE